MAEPTAPAVAAAAAQAAPPPLAPVEPAGSSPAPSSVSTKPSESSLESGGPLPEFQSKEYLQQLNRRFSRSMSGRMGEYGRVTLEVVVDKNGQIKSSIVLSPSPFPRLDKFAQDTVATWKFKPTKRNGVAEEATFRLPFAFEEPRMN
jgi:protein TonB